MKAKFLKISKPCSENWDNMTTSKSGHYCDVCAKTVVDFSKLSQLEISKQMQKINGNICARVTQGQLDMPLIDLDTSSDYKITYSNVAASLMLATTMLAAGQPMQSENKVVQTEISQPNKKAVEEEDSQSNQKQNLSKPDNFTTVKGIVNYKSQVPVINAKITFVTATRQFTTYSLKDGTFSFEIPTQLIDNDNVIRASYGQIVEDQDQNNYADWGSKDFILSKAKLSTTIKIIANSEVMMLGGISVISKEERIPIVLSDGIEIKYRDFAKAREGKKSSCSLENKDYNYFEPAAAIAIYGQKAKWGLYILNDKK